MDLKKKEVIHERSKKLNGGHDLSNAHNKCSKLQVDVTKCGKDFHDLACQVCDSKSELTGVKKELTSTKKKILEQLDSTLAHKELMKDKELEKEQIKYDKTKESNLSKLLSHRTKEVTLFQQVQVHFCYFRLPWKLIHSSRLEETPIFVNPDQTTDGLLVPVTHTAKER
jgi:hypothetical protein